MFHCCSFDCNSTYRQYAAPSLYTMALHINRYKRRQCFCILFLLFSSLYTAPLVAQAPSIPPQTQETLRQYVDFSNEIMHALRLMRSDFESINWQLLEYSEGLQEEPFYQQEAIFSNPNYFPISLDTLFQRLFLNNRHLPSRLRGKPFQLAGKIQQVSKQLRSLLNDFDHYFKEKAYASDKQLRAAFAKLQRAELLYYDLSILRDKLKWAVTEVRESYAYDEDYVYFPLLKQMQACTNPMVEALHKLRRSRDLPDQLIVDIRKRLNGLEAAKEHLLAPIPLMDILYSPHQTLPRFFDSSKDLIEAMLAPMQRPAAPTKRLVSSQPPDYYYHYNNVLLPLYNRYGSGVSILYNDLLRFSNADLLPLFEVTPSFIVWKSYLLSQKDTASLNAEEIISNALRKDSLRKNKTEAGTPSMQGFAASHLIFLLDVSFSMDAPQKMPLLKTSFKSLLKLMRPEDKVSIIVYSGDAEVLLPPTSAGRYQDSISRVIDRLKPRYSSDADAGVKLAYELAQSEEHYISNGNNRIILATDGNLVLKRRSQRLIEKGVDEEIKLSIFYFNKQEVFQIKEALKVIAALGGGNYSYIQAENAAQVLLLEAQGAD